MSISPDLVLQAYRVGVFPMAEHRNDPEIFWVDPRHRGIIPLDGFHLSRSLARTIRRGRYSVSLDTAFGDVMRACADRNETWINEEIIALYTALHERGHAHSIEIWDTEGRLAGGVYGVALGRAFCGESMFSVMRDGSKIALAWLVDHLRRTGFTLFDTQFITDHLASLGAIEIPRRDYLALLSEALSAEGDFHGTPLAASGQEVVQRITQTS
ncbi:leucyl/phenylalanyl-tRNA--protein transferase [Roseivivax halodurans JCM 10272]|uniref:Leucyl/phenylalanyl-tRNA--protein transferase n=1 Tax=Roseivivax halodurans JCM 10272 TaxID=1449350 RepID=X7EG56_9RHOB|nr:leucyl/phenylalanyl-tRNA--protein transferase [Roseivivax halodurans]ETX14221.1 leucyl/phenylalanyl-tRNA--protein transferase [Roseivivax halodurans JCM 10272]